MGARGELRLSSVSFRIFRERRVRELSARHAAIGTDLLRAYGRDPDLPWDEWRGHTFRSMSDELLAHSPHPVPALDAVVLAYQTPDLHVAEAAGCYLAERCPGEPVSFAVSEQAAGAPFTALRIADAMRRCGALNAGAVFVLDPTTPLRDDPSTVPVTDSAVLMLVGTSGDMAVESLRDTACADPAAALRDAVDRFPDATAVIGTALARELPPSTVDIIGPREFLCTSAWIALAGHWPLRRPALVADYDPFARRLYTCVLRPDPQVRP